MAKISRLHPTRRFKQRCAYDQFDLGMADNIIYGDEHCHFKPGTIQHLRYSMGFTIAFLRNAFAPSHYTQWK